MRKALLAIALATFALSSVPAQAGRGRAKGRNRQRAGKRAAKRRQPARPPTTDGGKLGEKIALRRTGRAAVFVKGGKPMGTPHPGAAILNNSGSKQTVGQDKNGVYVVRNGRKVGDYFYRLKQLPNGILTGETQSAKRGFFGGIKSGQELYVIDGRTGKAIGDAYSKLRVQGDKLYGVTKREGAVVEVNPATGTATQIVTTP